MSINGESLYSAKVSQFDMNASHVKFKQHYLDAVNNSLVWLTTDLNLSGQPDEIEDTSENLDLNAAYRPVLEAAIDYWLIIYGNKSGDPRRGGLNPDRAMALYQAAVVTALQFRDKLEVEAADDSEVIGLF